MIKHIYRLNAIATIFFVLASLVLQASPTDDRTPSSSPSEKSYLIPPEFYPYGYQGEQDFIRLEIESDNPGANTEIWHSLSENSGYTLVATLGPDEYEFYHYNLKPRTIHYYKARAVEGSEVSEFSEVYWQKTWSKNYAPHLKVRAMNETTIEITLTDRSYNSDYYEIFANGEYINFIGFSTDSAGTETIYWEEANPGVTYNISVTLIPHYDQLVERDITSATVTMPTVSCANVGSVERELWTDIAGGKVSAIPVYQSPNSVTTITSLQGPTNSGNNYGARIRGYLCPPQSGNYTFYISSDDQSELWVSTNADPATKRLVASVTGYTSVGQWDKYPTQTSAAIALNSGTAYYFEILHKESGSGDHLAVGWKLPNGAIERPIGGNRIIKFGRANYEPFVAITSPAEAATFDAPATFTVTTKAYDPDSQIDRMQFLVRSYDNGVERSVSDNTAPYTADFTNLPAGEYYIFATVYAADGQWSDDARRVVVRETGCEGKGMIAREVWRNIPGTSISSVDFTSPPNSLYYMTSFETGQWYANDYGSRIHGYICVPQTGAYTFWISSDDQSELWLSTNDDQNNKVKIASVTGATKFREYTKYASQKSAPINLIAGRKYYIQALHKEGTGNDFVSVGWQMPDGTMERPIAGNHLIPYYSRVDNEYPTVVLNSPADNSVYTLGSTVPLRATPSDTDGTIYKVDFLVNGVVIGEDYSAPYEMDWTPDRTGRFNIITRAYDNEGALNFDEAWVNVEANTTCSGTGTVYWEKWTNIPGTSLSSVPFDSPPNTVTTLTQFGTPNYTGNEYGSRIRAYLCVPFTGAYRFALASDDASELWISTDESPVNKYKIAYVTTALKGWSNLSPHRSEPVNLVAGRRYYIEVRHKEGNGADFVQVGWDMPNGAWEGPIPGNRLSPYEDLSTSANAFAVEEIQSGVSDEDGISLYPNPISQGDELRIVVGDMDETIAPTVEIMSATGVVMQSKQVTPSQNELTLQLDRPYTQGIYLVKIVGQRRQWVKKIQIK